MNKRTWTDAQLIKAVRESISIAQVVVALGLSRNGSYLTVNKHCKRLQLDTNHFAGQRWNGGNKMSVAQKESRATPLANVLKLGTSVSSVQLKVRLLRLGLKQRRCEKCLGVVWMGNPIPLELHHIDGDRTNNTLKNLQILCPNCHAQTDTYCGKNIKLKRLKNALL